MDKQKVHPPQLNMFFHSPISSTASTPKLSLPVADNHLY